MSLGRSRHEVSLTSTRILVVEDDTRTAELIALYLRHAGHKVWTVGDGGMALSRLRDESWDAVILDRMLPGADGLAVCQVAAAERDVPVIFVSALTLEEERLAGFDAGGDDYITKPFSPRELVARVAAVLRRRGARDHALSAGALRLAVADRRAEISGVALELTPSEYEILRALAERPVGAWHGTRCSTVFRETTARRCRGRSTCTSATCERSSRTRQPMHRCASSRCWASAIDW